MRYCDCSYKQFNTSNAEMVEWSIAAVLKTVETRVSGGSNPSLCAIKKRRVIARLFFDGLSNGVLLNVKFGGNVDFVRYVFAVFLALAYTFRQ